MNTNTSFFQPLYVMFAATVFMFAAALTGCTNSTTPAESSDTALYTMTLPDADNTPSVVSDSGLEQGCRLDHPKSDHRRIDDFGARLLRRLNLSDTQKAQVLILVQQHEDCSKAALAVLRSSDSLIFESFKPRFDSVRADLAAGTIDSATARVRFHALKDELRAALQANPDRATAQAALKACHDTFIENLRAILTADQQVLLDQWLAAHKK